MGGRGCWRVGEVGGVEGVGGVGGRGLLLRLNLKVRGILVILGSTIR